MLKVLKRIVQDLTTTPHLLEALRSFVQRVRKTIEADAISIYLLDHRTMEHVLVATDGLNPQAPFRVRLCLEAGLVGLVRQREEPINLEEAKNHPSFYFHPLLDDGYLHGYLGVPIIQHRKLYGVLCAQQIDAKTFDDAQQAFLITLAAQLGGVLAQAEASGELPALIQTNRLVNDKTEQPVSILSGIGCVLGIGIGVSVVVYPLADLDMVPRQPADDVDEELTLFFLALQAAREEMQQLSARMKDTVGEEEHALFDVYLRILDKDSLGAEVATVIREERLSAQAALSVVVKKHVQQFENMEDEYLRERASDFRDLGRRVLTELQRSMQEELIYPERTILIAEEITAADLAAVPTGQLMGIVSAKGANNSHVAILARALNIPAVMGVRGLKIEQLSRRAMVVDGYDGQVFISPSKQVFAQYKKLAEEEQRLNQSLMGLRDKPAQTLDGHLISLQVNIGLAIDTGLSMHVGAEGVGLYRSEVPFMSRDRFPSEDEQYVIYRQILKAFFPKPVTMRTLDIGGDKGLPYFPVKEDNPYLGWRGIRVTLDHPDVFVMQIRAMLRASEGLNNLRIMLPMITTLSEIEEGLYLIDKAQQELLSEGYLIERVKVGAMIEVPAAVALVRHLGDWVDFISVGSNDLTQYLLAVDRNNARVVGLYDPFHPAILQTLRQIVSDGHEVGLEVSICGELASDPLAVILLLGMGYDILSMNASSVLKIKWLIRSVTLKQAKLVLQDALMSRNTAEIRLYLEGLVQEQGLSELLRMKG